MKSHEKADHNFYVTANMVLNPAARAREIFESSEVTEKRQLLNLVFQNLQLRDVNLSVQVTESFKTMVDYKECPTNWRWRDAFRTFDWRNIRWMHKEFLDKIYKDIHYFTDCFD